MKVAGPIKSFLDSFKTGVDGASGFSRPFVMGMAGSTLLVLLVFLWLYVRADDTAQSLQKIVPVKTAMIEVPEIEQAGKDSPDVKLDAQKNISALAPAPIEGMFEENNGKYLPVIRVQDGVTPLDAYKKTFIPIEGASYISLVVVDYGLSEETSQAMLEILSPDITFALSPYAENPSKWASSSRAFGHEFWLSLPMETKDYGQSDTGPMTILKNAIEQENLSRLTRVLETSVGYCGLITQKGHSFVTAEHSLSPVIKEIQKRGLGLVESSPDMTEDGVIKNNIWLDEDLRPTAIEGAFRSIEQKAHRDGNVVVLTHPYPALLKQIKEWSDGLKDKNLQLAPLSYSAEQ